MLLEDRTIVQIHSTNTKLVSDGRINTSLITKIHVMLEQWSLQIL